MSFDKMRFHFLKHASEHPYLRLSASSNVPI